MDGNKKQRFVVFDNTKVYEDEPHTDHDKVAIVGHAKTGIL
jgi:hypothetical protein